MNRCVGQLVLIIFNMIFTKKNIDTVEEISNTDYHSNDSDGCRTPPEEEGFQSQHFADLNRKFTIIAKQLQKKKNTDYKQNDDSGCSTPPLEDEDF